MRDPIPKMASMINYYKVL